MTFKTFDVVVVPFPFTDKASSKRRPALVLSSNKFNSTHDHLVLGMLTTTELAWASDVPLTDWAKAGLNAACRFRLKLFTLEQSLVVRNAGRLGRTDQAAVQAALSLYLLG